MGREQPVSYVLDSPHSIAGRTIPVITITFFIVDKWWLIDRTCSLDMYKKSHSIIDMNIYRHTLISKC
jgi:hypothetical protein